MSPFCERTLCTYKYHCNPEIISRTHLISSSLLQAAYLLDNYAAVALKIAVRFHLVPSA